jgi:hypothetical protein
MSTEKPKMPRWYVVMDKQDGARCLVAANNQAQAFRRAGEFYCTARPVSVNEAIAMTREGADVISAPAHPEQLDLEEQAREPNMDDPEAAATALPNSAVLGARPLAQDSVVTGAPTAPVKGGKSSGAPGTRGASAPLNASGKRLARDVFGAGFTKTDDSDEK